MVVVQVLVNLPVFLWAGVDDLIAILFRHDIDLMISQVRLKLFGLFQTTRTERHEVIRGFGGALVPNEFA